MQYYKQYNWSFHGVLLKMMVNHWIRQTQLIRQELDILAYLKFITW